MYSTSLPSIVVGSRCPGLFGSSSKRKKEKNFVVLKTVVAKMFPVTIFISATRTHMYGNEANQFKKLINISVLVLKKLMFLIQLFVAFYFCWYEHPIHRR